MAPGLTTWLQTGVPSQVRAAEVTEAAKQLSGEQKVTLPSHKLPAEHSQTHNLGESFKTTQPLSTGLNTVSFFFLRGQSTLILHKNKKGL